MKKTLLISVVASTMIMAGGDIAPVEPAVVVPAPVAVAAPAPVVACSDGWTYKGQAVAYYQTSSNSRNGAPGLQQHDPMALENEFDDANSAATAGLSLKAENKNLFYGVGVGAKLVGLGTLGLENDVVNGVMQSADGKLNGGALTELYLTYGIDNTNLKVGRQELPQALSPFAFTETWNVFANTFAAALLVNTDLPQTTLVGAYVTRANNHQNLADFNELNDSDGVYMLTAQNKSIDGLTLTGTGYFVNGMGAADDVKVGWGDAAYALPVAGYSVNLGLQGGIVNSALVNDTSAYGLKAGTKIGMFDAAAAYSSVNDGSVPIHNLGTGIKTPLYTQMILNQNFIKQDSDTTMLSLGVSALGGRFGLDGEMSNVGIGNTSTGETDYKEVDLSYKTKVGCVDLFAAYVWQDIDYNAVTNTGRIDYTNDTVRVWGRYNF